MRASVFFREPPLLREMRAGDLFVPHMQLLSECVCTALLKDELEVSAGDPEDEELDIVVIACRVGPEEAGHVPTGCVFSIHENEWVTPVVPIERIAFRERMPLDEVPAVATDPRVKGEVEISDGSHVASGPQAQPEFMSRL